MSQFTVIHPPLPQFNLLNDHKKCNRFNRGRPGTMLVRFPSFQGERDATRVPHFLFFFLFFFFSFFLFFFFFFFPFFSFSFFLSYFLSFLTRLCIVHKIVSLMYIHTSNNHVNLYMMHSIIYKYLLFYFPFALQ